MAKRRLTKLDRYLESRIWNAKLKNPHKVISTETLIEELTRYYGLKGGNRLKVELRKMVKLARRRVYRKRALLTKNIKTWAQELDVPEWLVERWVKNSLLDKKNIDAVIHILKDYRGFLSDT
ncbi:MAG: hypothetical protein DRG59_12505 [Deltaproteobacteria bacterium]|nr:MAG: hypothetical protein DRG59_12505 [Deltaproteobacteria bacterium]